ncbi:MAG: hypothetical protein IPL14_04480 [Nitrospira sp.]|nr:hypothetical protein [Nitrospira sp.]
MNAGLVMVLIGSIFVVRARPVRSDQYDGMASDDPLPDLASSAGRSDFPTR